MKTFANLLLLLIFSSSALAFELKPGDIILIELRCYSCSLIADETGSRFSHSAVVLGKYEGETVVAQALGPVHALKLSKFLAQKQPESTALVMRPFAQLDANLLVNEFSANWLGRPFDKGYTWDDEKLYCSEFVAKFLEVFLGPVFPPKPLDFSRNWDFWNRVMDRVPQGEPGNSPGDFEHSENLMQVGELP